MGKAVVLMVLIWIATFSCCSKDKLKSSAEKIDDPDIEQPGEGNSPLSGITFNDMLGVNAFEWDFLEPKTMPNRNIKYIYEPKMDLIKTFTGIRHYLDWNWMESTPGEYSFSPTVAGGWDYDMIYERCKQEGILILACIKTIPTWMNDSYPSSQRDNENVPALSGKNLEDPASYIEYAQLAFQFAARYGSNKNVDIQLVSVAAKPHWNPNTKKVGLDLVKYIECNNEPDRWWKPSKVAQQTPEEYAANLSAFYDGHMGKLGPRVGVKTADPNMKVVIGGLAGYQNQGPTPQFVDAMVEWCRENRGYKDDGSVNLCFDVINYHLYSNNQHLVNNNLSQRQGIAPELSKAPEVADDFVRFAKEKANNVEVWVTELGYDINQRSTQRAVAIGNKSVLETQADWNLRSALLYARHGINRIFYYMLYDVNENSTTQYASSGMAVEQGAKRRPTSDYLIQARKIIGEYHYQKTINEDPVVDVYSLGDKSVYVLVVPDMEDRTEQYELEIGEGKQAILHELQLGTDDPKNTKLTVSGGKVKVKVTETPQFVEVL